MLFNGFISVLLFMTAALIMLVAGILMMGIRSVSGNSIAESYYQMMGLFIIGMSIFTGGLGTLVSSAFFVATGLIKKE